MRRSTLLRLIGNDKAKPQSSDLSSVARRALVETHGSKSAAWLIMQNRKAFHAKGAVNFLVPMKVNAVLANKLRWFFIAMDFIKSRPGWELDVVMGETKGKRTFRVKWLTRGTWKRTEAS